MLLWRATKRKSEECRSKKKRSAFSELSFELALALWLQWFFKIQFPDSIYIKLNILIAEWVISRETKKKSVKCRSKEQRRPFSELSSNVLRHYYCNDSAKTISRLNLFQINVIIAEWVILESHDRKHLFNVAAKNREVHFRVSF